MVQQTMIRASTKLDFAWALGCDGGGDQCRRPAMGMLGETGPTPSSRARPWATAEPRRHEWPGGVWSPRRASRWMCCAHSAAVVPAGERDPAHDRFAQPSPRPRIADPRHGAADADRQVPAGRQGHVGRATRPHLPAGLGLIGSALASRNEQYERFYLASSRATWHGISPSPTAAAPTLWWIAS